MGERIERFAMHSFQLENLIAFLLQFKEFELLSGVVFLKAQRGVW